MDDDGAEVLDVPDFDDDDDAQNDPSYCAIETNLDDYAEDEGDVTGGEADTSLKKRRRRIKRECPLT